MTCAHLKMAAREKSVLFVCLGNICRSPIAEAVLSSLVAKRKDAKEWMIDSAATSTWEIGNDPDHRGQKILKKNGITIKHKARQINRDDFTQFQYIFGMDDENIRNIKRVQPKNNTSVVKLLGEYDPQKMKIIEDPYYGEEKDFETVYQQVVRCCSAFLDEVSQG